MLKQNINTHSSALSPNLPQRRGLSSLLPIGCRAASALGAAALLLLGLQPAQAATDTWTGNTTANFNAIDGFNVIPTSGDSLLFNTAGTAGTTLNDNLAAGFNIAGFTFSSSASAYTIGGNSFALTGGITNSSANLQTINDAFSLTGPQIFTTTTGGGNLKFGGVISGAGGLTASGTGTTILATNNTFTGGTIVNGGTLSLSGGGGSGTVQGVVTVNTGGTLSLATGDAIGYNSNGTQVTTLNINGGTVNNASGGNEGYSTNVNLTGGTISGGGTFRFNNATPGSYGITSNASGTTSSISTNIDAFNGPLNFNVASGSTASGVDLNLTGAITSNSIIKSGAGNLKLNNNGSSFNGNVTINGGTLSVTSGVGNSNGNTSLGSDAAAGRTITVNNGSTLSFLQNNIFGSGQANAANIPTIVVNSGGLVTANNYEPLGAVTLNGGRLASTATGTGSYQGNQFLGTITVGGTSASTISNTTAGVGDHLSNNAGTTFNVGVTGAAGPDLIVSAPLINSSGDFGNAAGSLTKTGGGTMALTGTNTYTGATTISAGTLQLGSGGSLANTAVSVGNGGTFAVKPGVTSATNALAGSLTLNAGSNFTMQDNAINTFNVAGTSTLAPATAGIAPVLSFDLSGANGVTDLLNFTGAATNPTNVAVAFDALGTLTTGNTYTFLTAGSGLTPANFTLASNRVAFGNTAYNLALSGTATSETVTIGSSGIPTVYYDGLGGTTALNATNAGVTNFSTDAAGTMDAGGQPTLLSDVNFTATNVTTPQTIASLGQSYSVNSVNFLSGAPAITLNAGGGAGQTLTVNGGGITDASASNQTLNVPVVLGTVSQSVSNTGSGILTLGGTVSDGGFNLLTGGTSAVNISGVISGTGGLINTNTSTTTLTGANTYTGVTTINAGTLQLGDGATTNGSVAGNIADNTALTFANPNAQTYAGAISGSGTVTKSGAGTLTLSNGGSSFTGNVAINGGTLSVTGGAAANAGPTALGSDAAAGRTITVGSGSTLNLAINDVFGNAVTTNVPNIIVNGGTVSSTRYNAIGNITLNGATLSQNAADGSGNLMAGFQGYQFLGSVTVGGTSASTISSGATNDGDQLASNTTFNVGVTGATGPDLIVSSRLTNTSPNFTAGSLTKTGAGTMELTAANNYTGTTTISAGTLQVGNGTTGSIASTSAVNAGGTTTLIVDNNGALNNAATSVTLGDGKGGATVVNAVSGTQKAGALALGFGTADILDFGNASGVAGGIYDFTSYANPGNDGASLNLRDFGATANETTAGGAYQLLFDNALTTTQLGDFSFLNSDGSQFGAIQQATGIGNQVQILEGSSPAPEPAQMAALSLMGLGLGGLLLKAQKRRKGAPSVSAG